MSKYATLIKPPPIDPSKSAIENVLELTPLSDIGPDIFTNTRPLWHPPGARGIYGGAVIAQCLSAAQITVPPNFTVHSMHCYFVLAGDAEIPILYHVEHVREGKSFATRTVQARQRGRPIFTTTMSFVREGSGGEKLVEHAVEMAPVPQPLDRGDEEDETYSGSGPFESRRIEIHNNMSPNPHDKRTRQWIRARGKISASGGHQAHISALAYISDSYFIGTVSRVQNLTRFSSPSSIKRSIESLKKTMNSSVDKASVQKYLEQVAKQEAAENQRANGGKQDDRQIGMMVSLDHTIFFHNPRAFRADEWMFTEMESPWAGDGRGLVMQKMWSKDGVLIASCVQEGVVRLKQEKKPESKL